MRSAIFWMLCVSLAFLLPVAGCSKSGLDRVVVSGKVLYDGEPIPNGEIRFHPIEGTKGPISGGAIVNGEYVAKGHGGVPVGTYRVNIEGYQPDKSLPPDEDGVYPRKQYVPEKYNVKSELKLTVESGKQTQTRDFDLKK